MFKKLSEKGILIALFTLLLIIFSVFLILSDGYAGGADNMTHYRYARNAFQFPELFLWHWGKPIFTILASPFAQFGLKGVQFFNILCGLLSAFYCYRISKILNLPNPIFSIIIACFIPVYTIMMLSGMTEILFSLIAISSIFYFFKNKFILSAIIISFLPLARTEGIYIIPVLGLALLIKKEFKAIPFLLFASLLFSIIGGFYYDDFFWLITKMPYNGYKVYGTGPLFHFINTSYKYLGYPIIILGVLGIFSMIKKIWKKDPLGLKIFILIFLPFFLYFTAHSLMWWSGIGNSMGAHRYMAAVCPFFALLALMGYNELESLFRVTNLHWKKSLLTLIVCVFVVVMPFQSYTIPTPYDSTQIVIKSFSNWYLSSEYNVRKIYYYHPDIPYFINISHYDKTRCHEFIYNNKIPHQKIEPGELVLWDSYFSKGCGLLLDSIKNDHYFKLINQFGENDIVVFERSDSIDSN